MDLNDFLEKCSGFDWDKYNIYKNWVGHRVDQFESEQVFFNKPLIIVRDFEHSINEIRFYALGRTDSYRKLFVAFTIRDNKIRAISVRDMTRKENARYNTYEKKDTYI